MLKKALANPRLVSFRSLIIIFHLLPFHSALPLHGKRASRMAQWNSMYQHSFFCDWDNLNNMLMKPMKRGKNYTNVFSLRKSPTFYDGAFTGFHAKSVTSEERTKKFHADDVSINRDESCFWLAETNLSLGRRNQKHFMTQIGEATSHQHRIIAGNKCLNYYHRINIVKIHILTRYKQI